jgi:hypothetical protein
MRSALSAGGMARPDGAAQMARVLLLLALLPLGCGRGRPPAEVSFYHWKQTLDIGAGERALLAEAGTRRLFVRFFDVDLDGESRRPVPVSVLECRGGLPAGVGVVPVVFLTERVFSSPCDPPRLAGQVAAKIESVNARCGFPAPAEVQLDCDWTASSRGPFFAFLRELRRALRPGTALSATLRLHQVRFRAREGVPPVDRGALMLYNMGQVDSPAPGNSIVDVHVFGSYAGGLKGYPLPLDLALPVFQWGLVFRMDRLARIVHNLGADDVAAAGSAFRDLGKNRFLCRRGVHLCGAAIYPGDLLRLEAAEFPAVRECLRLARRALAGRPAGLVFYHLDALALERFGAGRVLELARET